MPTRSGGRYVIRNGRPVLIERSGHQQPAPEPAPTATEQLEEDGQDEDTQEAPTGSA